MRDQATDEADQIALTIAQLKLGDTLYAGYTANYARARHYMTTDKPGGMWRDLAVQQWQTIVDGAARDLQRRVVG